MNGLPEGAFDGAELVGPLAPSGTNSTSYIKAQSLYSPRSNYISCE